MTSDIHAKNLPGPLFEKHAQPLVGYDKHVSEEGTPNYVAKGTHEGRVSEVKVDRGREFKSRWVDGRMRRVPRVTYE